MRRALALAIGLVVGATTAPGSVAVTVRDSQTGVSVDSILRLDDGTSYALAPGRSRVHLGPGRSSLTVRARGYHPIATRLEIGPGRPYEIEFLLDPLVPIAVPTTPLIAGWVVDEETAQPLEGI
ncbi:MAG TPA: hypothetical protein VIL97_06150, partial [Thermoanaerobaculia bacterium]